MAMEGNDRVEIQTLECKKRNSISFQQCINQTKLNKKYRMTYLILYLDTQKLFRMRNTILHAFHHVDQQDMQQPKILQSVESGYRS